MIGFLIIISFGGFVTHNLEKDTLYKQCYEEKNLNTKKCSSEEIQKLVKSND
jgi:hypothetical protein